MMFVILFSYYDFYKFAMEFIVFRSNVTFAEVRCVGPGSNTTGRVGWEKHLNKKEVKRFVDIKFIDDGWLSKQP